MNDGDIIIRTANSQDEDRILKLLNEVFLQQQRSKGSSRDSTFWKWKYENNTFGKAILHVAEKDGELLATGTLLPWKLIYNGYRINCFQNCDMVVAPKARGKGIFKKILKKRYDEASDKQADLIFSFPNEQSLPVYSKMGWYIVGKIPWMVRILRPLTVTYGMIQNKQSEKLSVPDHLSIDENKVNALHLGGANHTGFLHTEVTRDYLKWRYVNHPTRSYGIIMFRMEDSVTGAAVFTLSKRHKMKEMVITELLGKVEYTSQLMKKVIREAKKMKIGYVAVMNQPSRNTNSWWKLGFIPRNEKNLVCYPLNPEMKAVCTDMSSWDLSAGMHDSI